MNYRTIIFLLFLPAICSLASSQSISETRNYIRTVPAGRQTSLELTNKYGTIQIIQWKKDSAMIRAEVKAVASNREKLDKMFEGVTINMSEARNLITAETSFSQNIGMIFENFKGMTSKIISYDSKIEINYYISVPEYVNLKIENKYGDVYMENCSGILTLSVSNGSFRANSIGHDAKLNLTFCDASISSMESGKIDANFSEIRLEEVGDVSVNSISSKYEIRKAGTISMESRRDKYQIEKISVLKGTSYFTDFTLKSVQKEVTLSARYGNLDIDAIETGFDAINLNTGYTDVSLEFEPGTSYNIDVRQLNSFLVISDKSAKTEKKVLNEDKKEYITTGTVGRNPSASKVTIDATHGDIYLK